MKATVKLRLVSRTERRLDKQQQTLDCVHGRIHVDQVCSLWPVGDMKSYAGGRQLWTMVGDNTIGCITNEPSELQLSQQ